MRRVALLIETSRTYGRELLRGVKCYAEEHGPWSLFVEVRDLDTRPPGWLRTWDGDGILTRSGSASIASAVRKAGVPAVELRSSRRGSTLPFVGVDNSRVAAMVAEYFLERGFRHFGMFSLETESFFIERRKCFVDYLKTRGITCSVFQQPGTSEKPAQWEVQQRQLIAWLSELQRPTAIMACTDQLGCWLLDACSRASVRVPEDVAIVGVENDETITTMSTPALSSVRLAGERIGFESAAILDRMMKGQKVDQMTRTFAPLSIETRQSSDIVAIDDLLLAKALREIRDRAAAGLTVADVLQAVPISRSSLERGCRRLLKRSPNEEINKVRIDHVCRLLQETELSLEQIASRTGFRTAQYMLEVFRRRMGTTPGRYRRNNA